MINVDYKNGNRLGNCMTVGELKKILSDIPDDVVVVGTWETMTVPLHSAELITDDKYISVPFVLLDVDDRF